MRTSDGSRTPPSSRAPGIVIARHPEIGVTAEDGGKPAAALLRHAGFIPQPSPGQQWHRLPYDYDLGEPAGNETADHAPALAMRAT